MRADVAAEAAAAVVDGAQDPVPHLRQARHRRAPPAAARVIRQRLRRPAVVRVAIRQRQAVAGRQPRRAAKKARRQPDAGAAAEAAAIVRSRFRWLAIHSPGAAAGHRRRSRWEWDSSTSSGTPW